jgi:hypothetical protein
MHGRVPSGGGRSAASPCCRAYFSLRMADQWLSWRLDCIAACLILIVAMLAISQRNNLSPSLTALSLTEVNTHALPPFEPEVPTASDVYPATPRFRCKSVTYAQLQVLDVTGFLKYAVQVTAHVSTVICVQSLISPFKSSTRPSWFSTANKYCVCAVGGHVREPLQQRGAHHGVQPAGTGGARHHRGHPVRAC